MHNNTWNLSLPKGLQCKNLKLESITFALRDEVFHKGRDKSELAIVYSSYISELLSGFKGSNVVGALIMEPVIQGACGMHMVDPLFQRVLVNECLSRKIPVTFDEIFTGFWRLGVETAVELIHCVPDIVCFRKLMIGGITPFAATLAMNAVFDAFIGDSKAAFHHSCISSDENYLLKALLHGHSYFAHAMGCTASVKSIQWFKDPCSNPNITSEG